MYTQEQGENELRKLRDGMKTTGEFEAEQIAEVTVGVRHYGYAPPSDADLDLFHSAVPHLRIARGDQPDTSLLTTTAKRRPEAIGNDIDHATGVAVALGHITRFLASLSSSLRGLVVWRSFEFGPENVSARRLDTGEKLTMTFNKVEIQIPTTGQIDAGSLYGALHIYSHVAGSGWDPKFFSLYQKAETLLSFPIVGMDGFLDEAFMGFFRCIEYLTLVKTLRKSGSFDEKKFAKAFELLKLNPTNPEVPARKLGAMLVELRGSRVAHLGLKRRPDLTPQEVFEIKKIVDMMLREHTRQNLP